MNWNVDVGKICIYLSPHGNQFCVEQCMGKTVNELNDN
jgi:hypothetical protein